MIDPDEKPDTADTVSDADADVVEATAVRPEGSKAAPKNEQFAGLNRLRRERTWVDVYLIGGTCLHGQIRSFDASMMLLQTRSGDIALYHHAISTVVRGQKRGGGAKPKRRPGFEGRSGSSGYESRPAHRPPPLPRPPMQDRGLPRDDDPGDPDVELPAAPRRAPVVVVKQRKTRSFVKPE